MAARYPTRQRASQTGPCGQTASDPDHRCGPTALYVIIRRCSIRAYLDAGPVAAGILVGNATAAFRVSGEIFSDGTATLDPIVETTIVNLENNPPDGTQYCVSAQNGVGATIISRCLDLAFFNPHSGEAANSRAFFMLLPNPGGVTTFNMSTAGSVLATRQVSSHRPTVAVIAPNGGDSWSAMGTQTIRWSATDLDGDSLSYSVFYSRDGTDWVPLASGIRDTHVDVNLAELGGSTSARVRVEVTDGVSTSSDESDSTFSVAPKAPWAAILAPQEGTVIPTGHAVLLAGSRAQPGRGHTRRRSLPLVVRSRREPWNWCKRGRCLVAWRTHGHVKLQPAEAASLLPPQFRSTWVQKPTCHWC